MRRTARLPAVSLLLAGCVNRTPLPMHEALSPADIALDSLPRQVGQSCGQATTFVDFDDHPGFRIVTLVSTDTTGTFIEKSVVAKGYEAALAPTGRPRPRRSGHRYVPRRCGGGGGGSVGRLFVDIWQGSNGKRRRHDLAGAA
jgi:hypothetical protein